MKRLTTRLIFSDGVRRRRRRREESVFYFIELEVRIAEIIHAQRLKHRREEKHPNQAPSPLRPVPVGKAPTTSWIPVSFQ